jgi:ParB/RepB/Spo0J family partition protein
MVTKKQKEEPLTQIHEVPIVDINISHFNVRESQASATKDLEELAASIQKHGLLQPVVLIGEFGKPPYELISGQRRYLAHVDILGRRTIRAIFAAAKLSKPEAVIRSLVENLQRVELEYVDTAKAVTYLYNELGSEQEVRKATGLSLQTIRDFILVEARATPKMKALIRKRKASPADVKRAIRAAQDNLKKAEELLDLMMKYKLSGDQKRRIVSYGQQNKAASAKNIFNEAVKARVEQILIVTLPDEIRSALLKATKSLRMDAEELTAQVLSNWLHSQGFV